VGTCEVRFELHELLTSTQGGGESSVSVSSLSFAGVSVRGTLWVRGLVRSSFRLVPKESRGVFTTVWKQTPISRSLGPQRLHYTNWIIQETIWINVLIVQHQFSEHSTVFVKPEDRITYFTWILCRRKVANCG